MKKAKVRVYQLQFFEVLVVACQITLAFETNPTSRFLSDSIGDKLAKEVHLNKNMIKLREPLLNRVAEEKINLAHHNYEYG